MKHFLKTIAATAMFVAAGASHAETILAGQTWNNLNFSGDATLSFSADLLGALDTGKIALAQFGNATANVVKDTDGFYTSASATAPIISLDINANNVTAVATTGGMTMTAPVVKSVSSGGSLTVTDLSADLSTKTIFATIIGGNGVGTLTHFALWKYDSLSGSTEVNGPDTYKNTISGLSLTSNGFTVFSRSLGLLSLGKAALNGITDYGTISSTIVAVPEPSTYALMGLGLLGMAATKRRRKA